jgi:hypothetical protein
MKDETKDEGFRAQNELVRLGKWRRGWRDGRYFYLSRFAKIGNLEFGCV